MLTLIFIYLFTYLFYWHELSRSVSAVSPKVSLLLASPSSLLFLVTMFLLALLCLKSDLQLTSHVTMLICAHHGF